MARIEKTIFISYRRTDVYTALAVYENLKNQGYDVFFDYTSISSGDFEQIITSNIRARAHFLLILTPTALDRCDEPGDWLRREIELAIDEKRNIVPLFFKGFRFGTPNVSEKLTGGLKNLSRYNGMNVHEDYFDEAMHRLGVQYLNIPLDTVLHPVSSDVQKVVREEQVAADKALAEIEDVKELVRHAEKPVPKWEFQKSFAGRVRAIPRRLLGAMAGGILLLAVSIWGISSIYNIPPPTDFQPTQTSTPTFAPTATRTPPVDRTNTPTITSIPPTPTLGIGSMLTGKDGMTLLYVPAGEFTMGSEFYNNTKPIHEVYLDAFWIDQTEVTNAMYAKCVESQVCEQLVSTRSITHGSYFGNFDFDKYPVIFVDWNMARTYCEWVDRRLPTEAEWEKAARGIDGRTYPWGNNIPNNNLLNYNNVLGDTTEVGNYPDGTSLYGALDMAGNAGEWVNSLYQPYPYSFADGREVLSASGKRVLRGCTWACSSSYANSIYRVGDDPSRADYYGGFRCAMNATP